MSTPQRILASLLLVLAGLAITGCGPVSFTIGSAPSDELTSTVVADDGWAAGDIAMVDVSGFMMNGARSGVLTRGENPVSLLREQLDLAASNSRVRAVILRLNSPGGAVTASDLMYRELKRFKKKTGKPVVALMMDVAASGAYYLACGADHIIAHPTTITGSIGVIVQTVSVKPALDRLGVKAEAITTGPNKDAGSPLGDLSDSHREVLRSMVDDFYARFLDVVREGRPNIPTERFAEATDGRVVTGEAALALGLVDESGDFYSAVDKAKRLAGLEQARVIRYHRSEKHIGSPYAAAPGPAASQSNLTQVNVAQFNLGNLDGLTLHSHPRFLYLWVHTP